MRAKHHTLAAVDHAHDARSVMMDVSAPVCHIHGSTATPMRLQQEQSPGRR